MSDWHVLGLDGDPTPGDPDRTADLAGKLLHQAELADHNRTRLDAVARGGGDLRMQGDYAPKFQEVLSELPGELGKLSTAYRGAGEALRSFASDLRAEKAKAATALRQGTDAATSYDGALREINAVLPTQLVVSPMLGVEASVEQATEGLDESVRSQARTAARRAGQAERDKAAARRLADDAARLRGDAEGRAVDGINRALDHSGIKNKSWWQKAWDVVSWPFQSWDNFVSFCRGVAFVVGIVALFISGPVGWALVGVALVAGAVAFGDTLVKFTQGKASLMDLGLDALGLIPGTAGAIKLAGLGTRLAEAGPRLLAMAKNLPETGRVVLGSLREARAAFGETVRTAMAGGRASAAEREIAQAAEGVLRSAGRAEPRVTRQLSELADETGGQMAGLKNRLKGADSLQRKIGDEMRATGVSADEAAGGIKDGLRYTMTHSEQQMAPSAEHVLGRLESSGYEVRDVKNYFQQGNSYKGVNVEMRTPEGQPFELQFHTHESFDLKMRTHTEYEIQRDMSQPLEVRQQAFDQMAEWSGDLAHPPGIDGIGRPVVIKRPVL